MLFLDVKQFQVIKSHTGVKGPGFAGPAIMTSVGLSAPVPVWGGWQGIHCRMLDIHNVD